MSRCHPDHVVPCFTFELILQPFMFLKSLKLYESLIVIVVVLLCTNYDHYIKRFIIYCCTKLSYFSMVISNQPENARLFEFCQ